MKTLIAFVLLPSMLCSVCRDCNFPYHEYLKSYHYHYKRMTQSDDMNMLYLDDLETERERIIFFSGATYALKTLIEKEKS